MSARVTLISHAVTPALRLAVFPLDEALEEREVARLKAMGWNAPRAQQVLTAPEQRAQGTASSLGLSATIAEDLRDCDYGGWRGQAMEQIQEEDPEGLMAWLTDPTAAPHGGESIAAVVNRVSRWLEAQTTAGHTVAVTHPAVIRSAVLVALNAPLQSFWRLDIAPASVTDLRHNGSVWTVRSTAAKLAGGSR